MTFRAALCACWPSSPSTMSATGSSATSAKPSLRAAAIWAPVTGEQLPDTTSNRSTTPGDVMGAWAESVPSAFQKATSAYSTPDDPRTNSGVS